MSTYDVIPRKRKIAKRHAGLKRLSLRSTQVPGYPRLLDIWVPEAEFQADCEALVKKMKAAAVSIFSLPEDTMVVET